MAISTWLELLALSVSLAVAMGYASTQQAGLAIVPWAQPQLAFVKKNVTKLEPKTTNLNYFEFIIHIAQVQYNNYPHLHGLTIQFSVVVFATSLQCVLLARVHNFSQSWLEKACALELANCSE